jgi:DNA helicase-2/ATP-dependent DNA helicase PcrA
MLRRHAELVGLQSNFTILDTDDQLRLLKQLILAADLDEKRWPARSLAGLIDRWKNRGWTPAQIDAAESEAFANGKGAELYAQYQARLRALNACDFGDLLLHMLVILKTHRDVLEVYQRRFKYILVDEYQDTNQSQYLWLRLLAQERKNICCVGDDDQSIYSWRGAEVANILRFEKDFPGAVTIRLEQNYRSTPHILAAASGVIANNGGRLGKTLWTEQPQGEQVQVIGVWDGPEEARRIGEEIESLQRRGGRLDDVAILVRAQFQTREIEDRFIAIGMPYRIIGGFRFYERAEIRDALAYLRVIAQPADDLAFRAHRQHAQARPGRQGGRQGAQLRACDRHLALLGRRADPGLGRAGRRGPQRIGKARRRLRALAPAAERTAPSRARPPRARRERLHRHAPGRPLGRKRRPARKPHRAHPRDGRI